uniref:Uncharacterized protein n=1 Tax=Siphoviridae sp. ctss15 TaxID=2825699 RepID=A0A8S5TR92_9CAUD|nr:MAG TPA: hypothetical protein [Siphoviridae sp. ctss15]
MLSRKNWRSCSGLLKIRCLTRYAADWASQISSMKLRCRIFKR